MKLSTAILTGCDKRAQAFGWFFVRSAETGASTSCALGAAIEGITGGTDPTYGLVMEKLFPILKHPGRGDAITKWNDVDRLSREAIAEKVSEWEREEEKGEE